MLASIQYLDSLDIIDEAVMGAAVTAASPVRPRVKSSQDFIGSI